MRKLLLALLLAALLPTQVQAASSVAGSWPTNATPLTVSGSTFSPPCPGTAGASGFYTVTVSANNQIISLPQCTLPADFKFAITQGAGGPYTGLSFSSAGTIKWPGGSGYIQTATAGALDYVSGTISNLAGSNEWDVTSITNVSSWAFVNATQCASAAGPTCTTPAANMAGANLIVVAVTYFPGGGSLTNPTDSSSNAYTLGVTVGTNPTTSCYFDFSPTVTSSMTFSATFSAGGVFPAISAAGFSGAMTSPLDQTNTNLSGSATTLQPGSITPTQANELVVACLGVAAVSGSTSAIAVNSGYTIEGVVNGTNGTTEGGALAYLIQSVPGATNPTFSWTGTSSATAGIMSFK